MSARRFPLTDLPPAARPALILLAALAALRAGALIAIAQGLASAITAVIANDDRWQWAIAIAFTGFLLRAASVSASRDVAERLAGRIRGDLRQQALVRVLAHGGADGAWRMGEVTALLTRELDEADAWFTRYLPALVGAAVVPTVLWAWIALTDWVSAVVIVLTLPLIPLFMALIGYRTRDAMTAAALERLSHQLAELARGLPVLVGLGRSDDQAAQVRDVSDSVRRRSLETLRIAFLSSLALELIASISVAIVAVFIGLRLVHGTFGLEAGLAILILAPEAYLPLRQVGAAYHAAESGRDAMRRVAVIAATPAVTSGSAGARAISDLSIRYVDRGVAIGPVSFALEPGTITYLAGASGAGKSSVLHALAGTIDPAAISGTPGITAEQVAFAAQHPAIAAETVRDDIVAAGGDEAVLARVGAAHLADRHPSELSPGEVRRVAIARVLARVASGATIALLDEPTAHLDAAHATTVLAAITAMAKTAAVVVTGHDARLAVIADVTVRLDGTAVGSAEPADASAVDEQPVPETASREGPVWPLLRSLVASQRQAFASALAFGVLAAIAAVALTAVSGWLIVRASEQPPILYLLTAIVGVRLCGIGRAVARYAERLWMHDAVFAALGDLRVRIWRGLAARGPASGRLLDGPETLDRLVGDVDRLRDALPRVILPPAVAAVTWAVTAVALAIVTPAAGLVILAIAVLVGGVVPWLARSLEREAARDEIAVRSRTMRTIGRILLAAADLRGNRMEGWALGRVAALDDHASALQERRARIAGLADGGVTLACGLGSLVMVPVASGTGMSAPFVAVLVLTPLALIDVAAGALEALRDWPALRQVAGRLAAITGDPGENESGIVGARELAVAGVSASWPGRASPVFSGVSFTVRRGQWVIVTGPSGAGKSTLLAVLLGFLRPATGSVRVDGVDVTGRALRQAVAWCPQDAHVFDSTIRANLLLARSRHDAPSDHEMREALAVLFPPRQLATLSLDTRIGSRGAALSGGQRQRLALARTLLTQSDIMLLDEPTAHLDAASAADVLARLRIAFADRIVVMVTHRAVDLREGDVRVRLQGLCEAGEAGAIPL